MVHLPTPPTVDEVFDKETIAHFCKKNTARQHEGGEQLVSQSFLVDTVNNALANLGFELPDIVAGTTDSCYMLGEVPSERLRPELRTFSGIQSTLILIRGNLLNTMAMIDTFHEKGKIPVSKAVTHKVLSDAFEVFDPDPNNHKAAECRQKLQDAAKVLGLEDLEKKHARRATRSRVSVGNQGGIP